MALARRMSSPLHLSRASAPGWREAPSPGSLQAAEGASAPPWARRILIVDDLETNRLLLELFLRREGFATALAAGGEEAVVRAAAGGFDVILMDLHMPRMDGFMAARRIRAAEPPGLRVPILALSASLARGLTEACLAAGMDGHLVKPLDLVRFRDLLARFAPAHAG